MSDILIDYWLDGELHTSRTRAFVPRRGDLIQLQTGLYSIDSVCWCENGIRPQVQIGISPE